MGTAQCVPIDGKVEPMPLLTARAAVELLKPCFGEGEGEKLVLLFLDFDQAVRALELERAG